MRFGDQTNLSSPSKGRARGKLAVGKKVDFDFVQAANGYVVTAVK